MAEESLKHKTAKGAFWKFFEVGGQQFIQFLISVILARLIAPSQFGLIALLGIFISISGAFVNSGFSYALIRKNNPTDVECCTVFYFNIVVSLFFYIILYLIAPLVSEFYNAPQLTEILRWMSISIVFWAFSGVQKALLTAKMQFKEMSIISIINCVISGSVGVIMAYTGFEVWALVGQSIVGAVVGCLFLWYVSTWRPKLSFSMDSLKEFLGFGSKILGTTLINDIYSNMSSIMIGKFYNTSDLAYFNRATSLKTMASTTPTQVLLSVTFPSMCKLQDNNENLIIAYRKLIRVACFILFPLCIGIGAVSYPLINVVYTSVWLSSAELLPIMMFAAMWYPISAINLNLIQVKGRTDIQLKSEIIKKSAGVIILFGTLPFGIKLFCYGLIFISVIELILNCYYTNKLIGFSMRDQIIDMLPSLILSIVMFVVCKLSANMIGNGLISLIVSVVLGVAVYVSGAYLFRFKEIDWVLSLSKSK